MIDRADRLTSTSPWLHGQVSAKLAMFAEGKVRERPIARDRKVGKFCSALHIDTREAIRSVSFWNTRSSSPLSRLLIPGCS
jgi:hypothetical protein